MKEKAFRESRPSENGMQIILGSFALFVTLPDRFSVVLDAGIFIRVADRSFISN